MQSRRVRWNRLTILIVSVLGILLVVCVGVVASAPNLRRIIQAPYWKTDVQLTAQSARKMFDYDVPPIYQELKMLTIDGNDAAVIIAHRERADELIFIEGVQDGIVANDGWRARYEENLSREMGEHRYNTQVVGTQKTTVRGQSTTLRLFEGTDENGRRVRQVVCGFAGKSGDVLMAIVAGQDNWNQAMVDDFLRSIR